MGRRNTRAKSTCRGFHSYESFASVDSNGTPSWLGSDRVQPDKAVLHGQVLSDQLTRWCCIDRLSSQDKLEIDPVPTCVSPCYDAASAIKCALRPTPSFAPRTCHSKRRADQLCTHIPSRTIARNRLRRPPNSCSNWAMSLACWPAGKASSP